MFRFLWLFLAVIVVILAFVILLLVFTSEPNPSLVSGLCLVLFTGIAYLLMNIHWLKNRI